METIKYEIVSDGDNDQKIIHRFIQLGRIDQEAASAKVKFLFPKTHYYMQVRPVTNAYYAAVKKLGIKG
ncbi:MAG: hypothetical protein Q8O68_00990 [Candidatus Daviesbacteria bacterium]|nr:hypothetical protein [Candidatus Daviesbacteria bacterium]